MKYRLKPSSLTAAAALIALSALTLTLPAAAQQRVLPGQSDISFTSRQMGVPVDGNFKKFDAQVAFDPKKPEAARIAFTVDLGSANLGAPETEVELAKPDWFNTKLFPQATFQSVAVKPTGAGKFDVSGKLSIKGASRDIVVPVSLTQTGGADPKNPTPTPTTTATGAFVLKRLEFKIGDGDWKDTSMVANDVNVKFKLTLSGVPAL